MKLYPREWVAAGLFALSFVFSRVFASSGPNTPGRWAMVVPMLVAFVLMLPTVFSSRPR